MDGGFWEEEFEVEENEEAGYGASSLSTSISVRHMRTKRTRKKRIRSKSSSCYFFGMEKHLPTEIIIDILSRLPFESILECKLVCQTWRILLNQSSSFGYTHLRHGLFLQQQQQQQQRLDSTNEDDDDKVSFLFLTMTSMESCHLYYGEYDDEKNESSCMTLKIMNHPPIKKREDTGAIVGSCNGLICFSVPYTHHIDDPVYISNPITKEYVYLPRFTLNVKNSNNVTTKKTTYLDGSLVSGFGYHPSTNEYKVVRIYYPNVQASIGQVQVYTLGSGSGWRDKEEIPYLLVRRSYGPTLGYLANIGSRMDDEWRSYVPRPSPRGILANGVLHWLDNEGNVLAFDLADEKFRLLPSPCCVRPSRNNFYQLQVLGGCLCVVHQKLFGDVDIWSLNKKNDEWERKFKMVYTGRFMDDYWPLTLTKSSKVLLRYDFKSLVCYDPKTATTQELVRLDTGLLSEPLDALLVEAIPHMNSFVSLKALGERSKIRRGSELNPLEM